MKRGADQLCSISPVLSSLYQRQSHPIIKREPNQLCSLTSVLLLAIPEAVPSHTKAQSRSAVQSLLCVAPRCPRGSLVALKSKERISCTVYLQCFSSLSQMQSCPIEKHRANKLCSLCSFCVSPCCPRGSLIPYKSEKQISCAVASHTKERIRCAYKR